MRIFGWPIALFFHRVLPVQYVSQKKRQQAIFYVSQEEHDGTIISVPQNKHCLDMDSLQPYTHA